ncbi:NADH-quinone oxidoreductase subunit L [Desmospora profundinema]|uniref:NADH-quinone oxidoreductase subunit L n=1 Tax=Desmospora profundinema TaxID=1571184 RepID=A0ABU1IM96_9BACL|nr:NADH-quinone oxidoreductase subunit L [Desmospora profundinema]MDR6225528.1 NADH-quinone oxidoreductase subunit L [Desmospora profundinema]
MIDFAWYIPLFPLVAFLLLLAGRTRWSERGAAGVSCLAALGSFAFSLPLLWQSVGGTDSAWATWDWFHAGEMVVTFGVEVNPLIAMMLVVISLVSLLVQVYARGYMAGDQRMAVFYAYLSLFTFSMLGLVLSPNLLQLYLFWELVGVCSFLLIGFWYWKPDAKAAAKKAFIVTRIGDIGLFVAMILLFWQTGSFELGRIFEAVQAGTIDPSMLTGIAILIFVGAMGKSGQFPLHTWLPDAMEGPTPVSALIHAATMVAAGVFLVARMFPVFETSALAMDTVAYVGAFTAIFAASIALVQQDIKRILAYSTVSQLGYMMLALGAAGYAAGVFHLMTHAFFKALLFLAAGAVIVALHHEQDIHRMGGMWKTHRVLGWLFLIGCLSLAGFPPFSGFFSKEEVLVSAYADGRFGVLAVGMVAAFFTAFYLFRLFFLVFSGERKTEKNAQPLPSGMVWPMVVLAILSVGAGFVEFPSHAFREWLTAGAEIPPAAPWWLPVFTLLLSFGGIALAWAMYRHGSIRPSAVADAWPWVYRILVRKYGVDEAYEAGIVRPYRGLGIFLTWFDRWVIQGLVGLASGTARGIGRLGSALQTGQVQVYIWISLVGLVVLIVSLTAGRLFE